MSNDKVDMVWAFNGITDPKLRKKLLSLENPSPQTFYNEGRRYESNQRKIGIDEKHRQASGKTGINAVEGETDNVNAISTANRKPPGSAIRICKQCRISFPPLKLEHKFCRTCWGADTRASVNNRGTSTRQNLPTSTRPGTSSAPQRGGPSFRFRGRG